MGLAKQAVDTAVDTTSRRRRDSRPRAGLIGEVE